MCKVPHTIILTQALMATKNQVLSLFLFLILIINATSFVESLDVCSKVRYTEICKLTMSMFGNPSCPAAIIRVSILSAIKESTQAFKLSHSVLHNIRQSDQNFAGAAEDCAHLMDITKDQLQKSLSLVNNDVSPSESHTVQTLLSAVITNYDTCLDSIDQKGNQQNLLSIVALRVSMKQGMQVSSNALAIFSHFHPDESAADDESIPFSIINAEGEEFPSWLSSEDRRTLLDGANANIVVAKDGSGNFKTITEALKAAPDKSQSRYVILVKAGIYQENSLEVLKTKTNIMLLGEGTDKTIITGSKNVVDGSTTFKSASLAVVGQGFMARDIAILNTAGPAKHQAVALRVGADKSVFYKCRIEAYQDTLYVHSLRQFFRDCKISGTVDFIFGNAAVVLQKCNIEARKPGRGQKNAVTAQGRTDPNQNTGISIQGCVISGEPDLVIQEDLFPTYLGRPWKEYSRTVVMQSYIGSVIRPEGWLAWDGDFALNTLFYAEYMNHGPGSSTAKRVTWKGYHVLHSQTEAAPFTVEHFIQGQAWLPGTGVEFTEGFFPSIVSN